MVTCTYESQILLWLIRVLTYLILIISQILRNMWQILCASTVSKSLDIAMIYMYLHQCTPYSLSTDYLPLRLWFLSAFHFLLLCLVFSPVDLLLFIFFCFCFYLFLLVLFLMDPSSHQQLLQGESVISDDIEKRVEVQPISLVNYAYEDVYTKSHQFEDVKHPLRNIDEVLCCDLA